MYLWSNLPMKDVQAFDGMAFPELKKTLWKPGELVTFATPQMTWFDAIYFSKWLAFIFFAVGLWVAFKLMDSLESTDLPEFVLYLIGLCFAGIGAWIGGTYQRRKNGPMESRFDWHDRNVTITKGSQKLQIPFSQVRSFEVYREFRTTHHSREMQKTIYHYRCNIFIDGEGFHELICSTKYFRHDRETAYERARTVAQGLSEHLGVRWNFHDSSF